MVPPDDLTIVMTALKNSFGELLGETPFIHRVVLAV